MKGKYKLQTYTIIQTTNFRQLVERKSLYVETLQKRLIFFAFFAFLFFRLISKNKIFIKSIMTFNKEDFTAENAQRLSVIIMKQMNKPVLTSFKSLGHSQQQKFNRLMNEYIQSLPEEWSKKLCSDFDQIVNEDLLTEDFDPSTTFVPVLNTDKQVLMTEEQREFLEKVRIENGEDEIKF